MSARSTSAWVVVKFGGTSVSTLANWRNIALVVKRRLEKGAHLLSVQLAIGNEYANRVLFHVISAPPGWTGTGYGAGCHCG